MNSKRIHLFDFGRYKGKERSFVWVLNEFDVSQGSRDVVYIYLEGV